jgi:hypothetical protein
VGHYPSLEDIIALAERGEYDSNPAKLKYDLNEVHQYELARRVHNREFHYI